MFYWFILIPHYYTSNIFSLFTLISLQLLGSAQNILILNLAVSNVLLCVVTMPLNLVNIIHNFWVLGGGQVSCDWWSWSHNTHLWLARTCCAACPAPPSPPSSCSPRCPWSWSPWTDTTSSSMTGQSQSLSIFISNFLDHVKRKCLMFQHAATCDSLLHVPGFHHRIHIVLSASYHLHQAREALQGCLVMLRG